jgi:phosphatidylserine decarboxylase
VRVAREGVPILGVLALAALAVALVAGSAFDMSGGATLALVAPLVLLIVFAAWFFRDPERRAPSDPRALVSPADGKVLRVDSRGLSVFMNVFDVHVCRCPMAGRIARVEHVPGSFLAAYRDDAAEHNERAQIVVQAPGRELRFTLVAGLVARRIVCRVQPGQELATGERVGLIRFGSRVDVALPPGAVPQVARGQRVRAGTTVIARLVEAGSGPAGSPAAKP